MLEYGICPNCKTEYFIDYQQKMVNDDDFKERMKIFKGNAAKKEFNKWKSILRNQHQGTKAKQYFYYGTFAKDNKDNWKTFRTNFNNEKELMYIK